MSRFDRLPMFISPVGLSLEITRDCNLSCHMCPRNFSTDEKTNMTHRQFIQIAAQMPALRHVTILGRGETLINPHVFDMLMTKKLLFTIVTNGFLLTEKNINKLGNVINVVVSIDSPNSDTYKKIRGASLDVLIRNLQNLKKIRPDIKLTVQSIIMKDNISELDGFLTLCKTVSAGSLNLINIIAFEQSLLQQHQINVTDSIGKLKRFQQRAASEGLHLSATPLLPQRKCFTPWTTPRVSIEGDVYPCCFIFNSSEDHWQEWCLGAKIDVPQQNYKMGNVFKTPMKSILNSDDMVELRAVVRRANKSIMPLQQIKLKACEINSTRFFYCHICFLRHNISC
ncbi:MAG: radical SAM protein [Nitrospirae bacterium YQR-1]